MPKCKGGERKSKIGDPNFNVGAQIQVFSVYLLELLKFIDQIHLLVGAYGWSYKKVWTVMSKEKDLADAAVRLCNLPT